MIAFEVKLNGERACVAGAEDLAVLTAIVTASGKLGNDTMPVRPGDDAPEVYYSVVGLTRRQRRNEDEHLRWKSVAPLQVGDVIEVRVTEAATADAAPAQAMCPAGEPDVAGTSWLKRPLRPLTMVLLGTGLLGLLAGVAAWVALPDQRNWSHLGWATLCGVLAGLIILAPIAAIIVLGQRWPDWLARHTWRLDVYSSLAMALAFGYIAGCVRHNGFDNLVMVALLILYLGATIETSLGLAARRRGSES